jgi:transposase-like protein
LHKAPHLFTVVVTLLCHGCPRQAIVAAFGLDERTVARWQQCAGRQCQHIHEHLVQQGRVDLQHVQADEMWITLVGRKVWMAMALAVPFRLWLGGQISPKRDLRLITRVVRLVRACALRLDMLICVDGLASYVTAFLRVFRTPVPTDRRGRPRLVLPAGVLLGQVVKHSAHHHVRGITRRLVHGTAQAVAAVLRATHGGLDINTAYIERLNATFRAALACLVRRGRALAHHEAGLTAGMYLVGCAYNFCWSHNSLRLAAPAKADHTWHPRTPAMAAGLTDHCWTMGELVRYQVPLPAWVTPKRRGRPPKKVHQPIMATAA